MYGCYARCWAASGLVCLAMYVAALSQADLHEGDSLCACLCTSQRSAPTFSSNKVHRALQHLVPLSLLACGHIKMTCSISCLQQPGYHKTLHGLANPCKVHCKRLRPVEALQPCNRSSLFSKLLPGLQLFSLLCLQEGEAQLKALQRLQRQAQDSFAHLVSFFGENPQALASDADFWSEVALFVQRFSGCQRQLRKQKLVSCLAP